MIPFGRIGGRVGAYAQAAAVDPGWLAPLLGDVDDATGATLPLNALTARQALDLIALPAESTLLVTGASGAVGSFAVQLAARNGHRVLAQASHDDEDWVASLGATEVLPRATDLATIGPIDAVLDAVPLGPSSTASLREGGTASSPARRGRAQPRPALRDDPRPDRRRSPPRTRRRARRGPSAHPHRRGAAAGRGGPSASAQRGRRVAREGRPRALSSALTDAGVGPL
jgi:hypothetical protein